MVDPLLGLLLLRWLLGWQQLALRVTEKGQKEEGAQR